MELWWKRVALVGDAIVFVPYLHEHVSKYHAWMQNPELLELTCSEPLSLDEEYEMQQSWANDPKKCTFIVVNKSFVEGELSPSLAHVDAMVGDVNLYMNDPDDPRVGELELMIAEPGSRRKGFGKEAAQLMMSFASKYLGIHKFRVKIGEANSLSINLFRNLGFEDVGYSSIFKQVTMETSLQGPVKDFQLLALDGRLQLQLS